MRMNGEVMTTMKKSVCLIGCVLGALLVGCRVEETTVSIPTSAVAKVSSGEVEYVKVDYTLGYQTEDKDGKILGLMRDVRRVMMRHLSKGAEIKIERDAYGYWFKASFQVPFGKESALGKAQKSIMVLAMGADGKIELRDGPGLALLNRDFKGQNVYMEDDDEKYLIQWANTIHDWEKTKEEKSWCIGGYGKLYFQFMGGHNLMPQIIEAPTNSTPIKVGLVRNGFDEDLIDHVIVKFNRVEDESFWHSQAPFVFLQVGE